MGYLQPLRSVGDFDADWAFNEFPATAAGATPGLNAAYASRVMAPKSGTISDILMGIVISSGNVDIGIYSFDGTTYTALWRRGSTAAPAANTWTSMGNPAVAVTLGTVLYIVQAANNATVTFARNSGIANGGLSVMIALGTAQRLTFFNASGFPLPATILESAAVQSTDVLLVGLRIT